MNCWCELVKWIAISSFATPAIVLGVLGDPIADSKTLTWVVVLTLALIATIISLFTCPISYLAACVLGILILPLELALVLVLGCLGFTAAGVGAGSCAAGCHSSIGNVAPGSCFARCQSIAANGGC